MNNFYVYEYLRNADSDNAKAGTPYYIGKGRGKRVTDRHYVRIPKDKRYVRYIAKGLSESDAFQVEMLFIFLHGRCDRGTGILHNRTDGGEGVSGAIVSQETRELKRRLLLGRPRPEYVKEKLRGQKRSPETIQRMRERNMDAQWCANISKARKENPHTMTADGKARLREALSNRVVSEETRAKLRASSLGNTFGRLSWGRSKRADSMRGEKTLFD